MDKYYNGIAAILLFICVSGNASGAPLFDCLAIVEELNKNLPVEVNQQTTLQKGSCKQTEESVSLIYNYRLDSSDIAPDSSVIVPSKTNLLEKWCSEPQLRSGLMLFDIKLVYEYKSGQAYEQRLLRFSDCL